MTEYTQTLGTEPGNTPEGSAVALIISSILTFEAARARKARRAV